MKEIHDFLAYITVEIADEALREMAVLVAAVSTNPCFLIGSKMRDEEVSLIISSLYGIGGSTGGLK